MKHFFTRYEKCLTFKDDYIKNRKYDFQAKELPLFTFCHTLLFVLVFQPTFILKIIFIQYSKTFGVNNFWIIPGLIL